MVKKDQIGSIAINGIVIKAEKNYFLVRTLRSTFYISQKNNSYEIGDVVSVVGHSCPLTFSHYQESFDFEKYLKSFGAYNEIKNFKVSSIFCNPIRLREIKEKLLEPYSVEAQTIIGSMLFKDAVSNSQAYSVASNLGINYLLSSSNIHISFLFFIISNFAQRKIKERKVKNICLLWLSIILIFSEFSISIERIWLMYFLSLIHFSKEDYNFNYVEKLSLAGLLILTIHPFYVLNMGFYYTFPTLIIFSFIINTFKKREKFKKVKICLVFFILLLPYHMMADHAVNVLSVFFQISCAPIFSVIYLLDNFVFLGRLSQPFLEILNSSISHFLLIFSDFSLIVPTGFFSYIDTFIYFLFLLTIVLCHELNFKRVKKTFSFLLILLLFFTVLPNYKNYYEVHFIDVGQGDSTLIRYRKKNILIDTGGSIYVDLAKKCLIPYFHKLKINRLDAVLTTHEDYDHVGALSSLEDNFPIAMINRGGNEQRMDFGDFYIDDINKFKDWKNEDRNYTSAVYSFKIFDTSFLIMGDAPIETEKKLLHEYPNLRCDVLKVGHHGSDTSSCFEFLYQVHPQLAIISCGYNNKYGHPKKVVLDNLNRLDIPYIRTDETSTYVYKISA
ncbi:MAG: ComEC/Rec2 family competence protein [Bacilli bacterium]|nr:ComEC/Rec2 family competence protein [Bacilli bacterium]